MDEFTKNRILNLEENLKSRDMECKLLKFRNFTLEQKVEATELVLKLMKSQLALLEAKLQMIVSEQEKESPDVKSNLLA